MKSADYELIDFGDGRKLERFGALVLDRPCPAAERVRKKRPAGWSHADARYQRTQGDQGKWTPKSKLADHWPVTFDLRTSFNSRDPTGRRSKR